MTKQLKNPGNIQTVVETQLGKMITNTEYYRHRLAEFQSDLN